MPTSPAQPGDPFPPVRVIVTPRFEIFYALQCLGGSDTRLAMWRREATRDISDELRARLSLVAPSAMLWPLLADSASELPADAELQHVIDALREMQDEKFQRAILGGVFKAADSVDTLLAGEADLREVVRKEARSQARLLSLLGVHPFRTRAKSVVAFQRLVSNPEEYRLQLADSIAEFWSVAFERTWGRTYWQFRISAERLEESLSDVRFNDFARRERLPIVVDDDAVKSVNGGRVVPLDAVDEINLIPSTFNTLRLWAAYADTKGRTRFFIPLLDERIVPNTPDDRAEPGLPTVSADPGLSLKVLGDTTRYAMASMLARRPMTSVELARAFKVSKPTISHHVSLFRAAGLLREKPGEHGIVLELDREAVERIPKAAVEALFSDEAAELPVRRSRRVNKRDRIAE